MRPVNKGDAPKVGLKKYQDAEPYLENRIGPYCSFCELPLQHVPEVEHKESKSKGGEELEWGNFLLSCKYCNTRKGDIVKKGDLEQYLWPDTDDTFHAFNYEEDLPRVNVEYLNQKADGSCQKAVNLLKLVKLDNRPAKNERDRRFFARNEAKNNALMSREGWLSMETPLDRDTYLETIVMLAKASGFFSVWMTVFKDIKVVKRALLNSFPGTRKEYFEE